MDNEVVIFGGGFNPIALHHESMARRIHDETGLPVWIMPCYDHRFEKDSELIESGHRWNMIVEVAVQNSEWMVACDWEIAHQHDGSMFQTMEMLTAAYPTTKFHIAIGMDNANVIETKWDRGWLLIQKFAFLVFMRPGEESKTRWYEERPHRKLAFHMPVSSSDIRAAIREGRYDFAKRHLNSRVWDYIRMGGLYGYQEKTTNEGLCST